VSRAEQLGQPVELFSRRVDDLDLALALGADDPHARHQRPLEPGLERGQLRGAPPPLPRRGAARAGRLLERANRVLRRPDRPRVRENVVAQPELVRRVRQREQRPRMSHREPPPAQIRLDLLW